VGDLIDLGNERSPLVGGSERAREQQDEKGKKEGADER